MSLNEPSFTVGIEEEYLIVDPRTGDLVASPPRAFFDDCRACLEGHVTNEFLQSQIEVGTGVHESVDAAGQELASLRRTVADIAGAHGMAPIAASTHPMADWSAQQHTEKERYQAILREHRSVAQRLVICGMHVHVGIEDPELRIDIFNQITYFLPHLLALSTSSPFWQGRDSGLKSYRLTVFDSLPRTGLPESFASFGEYERTIHTLVASGTIEDATRVWWDLRPSARFPTLEMRITDICTRIGDAVAIAALFRCLARMLYRLRRDNQRWRSYSRFLINENRWRAQRYGTSEGLIDFGRRQVVPFTELVDELIDLIKPDAAHFGCQHLVEDARAILDRGTSADRQICVYTAAKADGADDKSALAAVVSHLVSETIDL
ncbi:Carboxylate-amine ligase bll3764 [hydrothermal vent metagenome]|uniref:Carboxylate-amine ligase bll3764 n=1 Tax=hydrothermal vent metagenome TaxID=652676 RepID=A0A3B0TJJ2_9ZZZZ